MAERHSFVTLEMLADEIYRLTFEELFLFFDALDMLGVEGKRFAEVLAEYFRCSDFRDD